MKQDDPQFKLRLPPDLKQELENEAKANTRTLGAEIVARLETSLQQNSVWSEFSQVERMKAELVLRAQIQHMVQRCGILGYDVQILIECFAKGGVRDKATAAEVARIEKDAAAAVEEASRALPERLVEDLRAAIARSAELASKLGPGGYIPPLPEEPAKPSPKARVKAAAKKR